MWDVGVLTCNDWDIVVLELGFRWVNYKMWKNDQCCEVCGVALSVLSLVRLWNGNMKSISNIHFFNTAFSVYLQIGGTPGPLEMVYTFRIMGFWSKEL